MKRLLGKLDAENVEFYLLGDLNCNVRAPVFDHPTRVLTGITDLCGLHQLINEPTRITEKTSTTIDLIFANEPDKIVCSGVSHVGISDHSLIYAFCKLSASKHTKGHTTISYRNFNHFDADSFRNDISLQDWDYIKTLSSPNQMWRAWKTIFNNVVVRHAPLRTKRVRGSKAPWITTELKQLMHQRDVLKIKAFQSKNPQDWSAFKKARNTLNNDIKRAKEEQYKTAFCESEKNLKRTWSIINEITSRKQTSSLVKEVKCNDKTFTDPNQICEVFNVHFASIGPKLAEEIPVNVTGHSYLDYLTIQNFEHCFQFQETNTSAVFSLLSKLCKSKATGLDGISAELLRVCPDLIAESLCAIFNRSMNTGIFPTDWKSTKVIPLFKKGERRDLNNYRPISNIPVVAKVFREDNI